MVKSNEKPCVCNVFATFHTLTSVKSRVYSSPNVNQTSQDNSIRLTTPQDFGLGEFFCCFTISFAAYLQHICNKTLSTEGFYLSLKICNLLGYVFNGSLIAKDSLNMCVKDKISQIAIFYLDKEKENVIMKVL